MEILENARDVDRCVGMNLRETRKKKGLSQHDVARVVGLTFQQIQKYEKGHNRISCSKLWQFSQIFNVPVSCFFQGIGKSRIAYTFPNKDSDVYSAQDSELIVNCPITLHATILEYLEKIEDMRIKEGILNFVKTLKRDCD